tara:strand:+ start:1805 stop:2041 length:237 start_codon:yes stop_codon:yes gene_type:complete
MANRISSNSPFKGKPNLRAGAGPVYISTRLLPYVPSGKLRNHKDKPDCYGPYDNLVNYVWEVDTSNGYHIAYVDCDYV